MTTTTFELVWLKSLLASLDVFHKHPMRFWCENQAALYIISKPVFHKSTKHIEVDFHLFRDHIQADTIAASHICSVHQLVDIFTKTLGHSKFHPLIRKLGIHNLHAST